MSALSGRPTAGLQEGCALSVEPAPTPPTARRRLIRRLFRAAGERKGADEIAIAEVVAKLGDRSFGWLLLFFAVLSLIPIPGAGMFTAIPLFWVLGQMALGLPQIRLPDWVMRRRVNRRAWQRLVLRLTPAIRPLERMLRPRLPHVLSGRNERMIGGFLCLNALALFLPVPVSGFVSASALLIAGLGLVERDGLTVLIGVAVGFAALLLTAVEVTAIYVGVVAITG